MVFSKFKRYKIVKYRRGKEIYPMNKKSMLTFFVVAALSVIFTQGAFADYTATTVGGSGYGPYQTGRGGEFTLQAGGGLEYYLKYYSKLTTNQGNTNGTFQSFCIEENEYIYPNTVHSATISNEAMNGGLGGARNAAGYDPISIGTAWLYFQFATGSLSGYDYSSSGRGSSASDLQNTIWWLEGEATDPGSTNIFRNAVLAKYGSKAMDDNNRTIPVAALNLWADGQAGNLNYVRQDQLVVTATPVPAAAWLLGSGLLGLVGIRRRFNQ